jgi:hypothetical protein
MLYYSCVLTLISNSLWFLKYVSESNTLAYLLGQQQQRKRVFIIFSQVILFLCIHTLSSNSVWFLKSVSESNNLICQEHQWHRKRVFIIFHHVMLFLCPHFNLKFFIILKICVGVKHSILSAGASATKKTCFITFSQVMLVLCVLTLSSNSIQFLKWLSESNALAYHSWTSMTKKKFYKIEIG